jgi:hypothetical protein
MNKKNRKKSRVSLFLNKKNPLIFQKKLGRKKYKKFKKLGIKNNNIVLNKKKSLKKENKRKI